MRYICLVYLEEKPLEGRLVPGFVVDLGMTRAHEVAKACNAYDEELQSRGHLILGHPLSPSDNAITVRVRDGKMSATDGPFAETKEVLGGFILVEARDLNEAIRIAAEMPLAKLGSIEVRPIHVAGAPG
jgi:hypothetical protein